MNKSLPVRPVEPNFVTVCGYCGKQARGLNDVDHEGEEDKGVTKGIRAPWQPSAREVEDHNLSHYPFRSWCQCCVFGKAVAEPHRKEKEPGEEAVPTVAIDYMYLSCRSCTRAVECV